jgi:hypothetical protein
MIDAGVIASIVGILVSLISTYLMILYNPGVVPAIIELIHGRKLPENMKSAQGALVIFYVIVGSFFGVVLVGLGFLVFFKMVFEYLGATYPVVAAAFFVIAINLAAATVTFFVLGLEMTAVGVGIITFIVLLGFLVFIFAPPDAPSNQQPHTTQIEIDTQKLFLTRSSFQPVCCTRPHNLDGKWCEA